MVRKILGVIAGYTIFVITGVAYFQLSGHKPHAPATGGFQLLTAVYGAFWSMVAGYVLQLIARTNDLKPNFALAVIIAGFALFSMLKSTGSSWTQVQAMAVFAPASVLGGWMFLGKKK
ncbi:hypothetical protein [Mucilaginibacter myungsuensis]|uniref:Uncharacterized protein n=1 Tax=Mucilaginibacter myungsuensis TaxID=649104 RepID=A0A929KV27_9SPHI|nr:hypothetical protein [Mucilaginibacter myungsuensis]MBE9662124.1 hypothetical protein [Mucilaginibacter myungsuensis]MDN3599442.1 hypothetical protein [Mucilaginibacter myungsuensis]